MHLHSAILVDDESFTRKGLMKLIDWEACGFHIVGEADNGEDALELIKRVQPDLVITDIRMPVIDGLELIRRVTLENIAIPYFIIISGYNDFNYAQQAMRYGVHDFVVKPIDEVEFSAILDQLNHRLRLEQEEQVRSDRLLGGEMIKSLILGEANEASIAEWEHRLQLRQAERLYYLFAELNDNHGWQPAEAQISDARFKEVVEQELNRITAAGQPICLHEHRNRIGILLPSSLFAPFNGELERFLSHFRAALDAHFGKGVFLYAGSPVHKLSDIRESYMAAKEAILYKYVNEEQRIVISEQIQAEKLNYIGFDSAAFNRFMEQMEELQLEAVKATIDRWFHDFREKRYAPEAVKMNIQQCLMGVLKTIRSMEGDEQALLTLRPLLGWHDINLSLGELKRLFTAFIEESQLHIAELRKEQQKGGIQKIKSYIEVNYSQNMSLKSIAAQFYVNPVYLGQLFKKTYGVYFNEFLLQLRVNEAKKLLRQSCTMRIYEIAEMVGFSNADYFVTQFEKIEHMTPSEYRNKLI
ncbi:response regulator [Bacillus sp. FJAT-26390]|uniref:response regulator n=1 Tax=Bacillus sp. FJAT-26390 TaxID=1743142 RepID=UPI000807C5A9|nr:response regulator [Bacillus sp. FJAT-26390]OBZ12214.1 DNA-binding response regulator [Bacillus sp. FJAT-26390]